MTDRIPVTLCDRDMEWGASVGVRRQVEALRKNLKDSNGLDPLEGGWTQHIEGACGELAVANFLGIAWSASVNNFDGDDVGPFQVRTRSRHNYDLLIRHPKDRDEKQFILVTGLAPHFLIRGWITAREGKAVGVYGDPTHKGRTKAYFVQQRHLRPMSMLDVSINDPMPDEPLHGQPYWPDDPIAGRPYCLEAL